MNDIKKLKIAFLTALDPDDRRSYSGSVYYMARELERNENFETTFIKLTNPVVKSISTGVHKVTEASVFKKKFRHLFIAYNSIRYARIAKRKIKNKEFDFIIAPAAAREIAFLKTKAPIVYLNDTTWGLLINYYANFTGLANIVVSMGNSIEKRAINNSSLIVFSSQWAANSVIIDYGAAVAKVSVIPWGANMDSIPKRETVLTKHLSKECRLLFIGRSWVRKRGQIAFDTLLGLEKLGIRARLVICGCKPPDGISHPNMTVIQNLDKSDEQQRKQLEELFLTSDFFLLPTQAECSGISLCEAAAFGLPVITTDTGGLASTVEDGITGYLLPVNAGGEKYAAVIKDLYSNESKYMEMAKASRNRFEEFLNWHSWANSLAEKLKTYNKSQTSNRN